MLLNRREFLAAAAVAGPAKRLIGPSEFVRQDAPALVSFGGMISRQALEGYLLRSLYIIGLSEWSAWCCGDPHALTYQQQLLMIRTSGAKLIGRAANLYWGPGFNEPAPTFLKNAARIEKDVHAIDPDIILQATILEAVAPSVNTVPVPSWVFDEFGLPQQTRNFDYQQMIYTSGYVDQGTGVPPPDISRLESQMWYYFWARSYIDLGYENIHLGVLQSIDINDRPAHTNLFSLAARIRKYGRAAARRNLVILDAYGHPQVNGVPGGRVGDLQQGVYGFVDANNMTLLDYNAANLRPKENPNSPQDCILAYYQDTIFGRSLGGITPSGWSCDHLPYAVELDVGGVVNPGVPLGWPFAWGWEESTWFGNQSNSYRKDWLRYAFNWIRSNDPNGFFRMPGSTWLAQSPPLPGWYHACAPFITGTPSGYLDAVGFNDLPVIQGSWNGTDGPVLLNGDFSRPVVGSGLTEFVAPAVPSWTFSGASGVAIGGSQYAGALSLPAGQQVGFVQGSGSLIQALSFPGSESFVFQFTASQQVTSNIADSQELEISFDNVAVWRGFPAGTPTAYSVPLGVPAPGVHTVQIAGTSNSGDTALLSSTRVVPAAVDPNAPVVTAVASAAGGTGVAPGGLIAIYGTKLTAGSPAQPSAPPLPTSLGGVTVSINGLRAPLLYVSVGQINAQIPYEAPAGPASLVVESGALSSGLFSCTILPVSPDLFRLSGNAVLAINQDGSINRKNVPAPVGSTVTLYLTGQGQLDHPVATGAVAPASPLSRPTASASATLAGVPAAIAFLGLAPGLVEVDR
jgi:uncharacterized protein (TIGR03437 family)